MKAFVTVHANPSEWGAPNVLATNIRYRHLLERPDYTLNLFAEKEFVGIGGEHRHSFCGELPLDILPKMPKYNEIILAGLYKDQCLSKSFDQIVHCLDRTPKEYSVTIPSNCVIDDTDSLLASNGFDRNGWYGDRQENGRNKFHMQLLMHNVKKIVDLSKGPDVTYKLVPKI